MTKELVDETTLEILSLSKILTGLRGILTEYAEDVPYSRDYNVVCDVTSSIKHARSIALKRIQYLIKEGSLDA